MYNINYINNLFKNCLFLDYLYELRAIDIKNFIVCADNNIAITFSETTPTKNFKKPPLLVIQDELNFKTKEYDFSGFVKNFIAISWNTYFGIILTSNNEYGYVNENNTWFINRTPNKILCKANNSKKYFELYNTNENSSDVYLIDAFKDNNSNVSDLQLFCKIYKELFFTENDMEVFIEINNLTKVAYKKNNTICYSESFENIFNIDDIKQIIVIEDKKNTRFYVLLKNGDLFLGYENDIHFWLKIDSELLTITIENFYPFKLFGIDFKNNLVEYTLFNSSGFRYDDKFRFISKDKAISCLNENFTGIQYGFEYKNGYIQGYQNGIYFINNEKTTLNEFGDGKWKGKIYKKGIIFNK
jgi:hypothetical protein